MHLYIEILNEKISFIYFPSFSPMSYWGISPMYIHWLFHSSVFQAKDPSPNIQCSYQFSPTSNENEGVPTFILLKMWNNVQYESGYKARKTKRSHRDLGLGFTEMWRVRENVLKPTANNCVTWWKGHLRFLQEDNISLNSYTRSEVGPYWFEPAL